MTWVTRDNEERRTEEVAISGPIRQRRPSPACLEESLDLENLAWPGGGAFGLKKGPK